MNEQDNRNNGNLVPAGHRDLAHVAAANPLVSRGLADLLQSSSLETTRSNPRDAQFYLNRGCVWISKEDYEKAIHDYDTAIRLDPGCWSAYLWRGHAWSSKLSYEKAIQDYYAAIQIDSKSAVPFFHIAWLLATCPDEKIRDGKHEIKLAKKACEKTDWRFSWELNVLAAAFAEAGRFDEAEAYQKKAIKALCNRVADKDEESEFRGRLELYRQKRPFRESP